MQEERAESVSGAPPGDIRRLIRDAIAKAGGWIPFDRFMELALYAPGLGYYSRAAGQIGRMPADGSDFVTAPVLSPLFGRVLARQLEQALRASDTQEIWEFGAGTGVLAAQLLDALGDSVQRYTIVDLSGALRSRQQAALARFAPRVRWVDELPERFEGVIVGNEVLDALPVQLLHFDGRQWCERGLIDAIGHLVWDDRPTALRPPVEADFVPGTTIELQPRAAALVRTLAERLTRGAAFFIDYGFPEVEFYLPQRIGGTLMCHRAHLADVDPLADIGDKDITAHVDFSALALAAQDAGLEVLGYTSQANFLFNCGLAELLENAGTAERANAHKLIAEHEMGELFKVIGFAAGCSFEAIGFSAGDRTHRL